MEEEDNLSQPLEVEIPEELEPMVEQQTVKPVKAQQEKPAPVPVQPAAPPPPVAISETRVKVIRAATLLGFTVVVPEGKRISRVLAKLDNRYILGDITFGIQPTEYVFNPVTMPPINPGPHVVLISVFDQQHARTDYEESWSE